MAGMRSPHSAAYQVMLRQLVRARKVACLTQLEAARALGIPQSRLSRIETGERRLDVIELDEIAKLYKKPLTYFVPRGPA